MGAFKMFPLEGVLVVVAAGGAEVPVAVPEAVREAVREAVPVPVVAGAVLVPLAAMATLANMEGWMVQW